MLIDTISLYTLSSGTCVWQPESAHLSISLNVTSIQVQSSNDHHIPANTKRMYNIYTMLDQRRKRWADVV